MTGLRFVVSREDGLLRASKIQVQLGWGVRVNHDRDAPILLVHMASRMLWDLARVRVAIASRGLD